MEQELIARVRAAKGEEAKTAAVKVLQAWRRRERMIAKHGSAEAADAAIAAEDANLEADRVRARERELAACGDRRALEFQVAWTDMGHRTDQGM
jgi:hypothetical protein